MLALLGLVILGVARWVEPGAGAPRPEDRGRAAAESAAEDLAAPAGGPGLAARAGQGSELTSRQGEGDEDPEAKARQRAQAQARIEAMIATFEAETVYPSWSRPVDGSNRQVIDWNQPESSGQPFAEDDQGGEIRADLGLSKMFVGPGEPLTARVEARYTEGGGPAPLDQVQLSLDWFDGTTWRPAATLEPIADGEGWRAEVVPSQVPALRTRPVDVRIRAYVKAGAMDRELTVGFRYAASEALRILGLHGDRLDQGDLLLLLEVEVLTLAPIFLQATLFEAAGARPLAVYEDYHRPTQLGRQVLPVRIYGRVLNEQGLDGPYRLGRIHGFVYRAELEPREQFFAGPEGLPLLTGAHRAKAFRSEAFDSPEKREKLAQYRAMLDRP